MNIATIYVISLWGHEFSILAEIILCGWIQLTNQMWYTNKVVL